MSAKEIDNSAGDRKACFERLLSANGAALARLAASYARTAADQEDLLQDIALALWQSLPRFRRECSERTFLFRVAQNRAFAHLAKRKSTEPLRDAQSECRDRRPDPEEEYISGQQQRRFMDALRGLPFIYREVITLALEGMSYGEIADITGITESNVGVRMNRGKELLRKALESNQP